MNSLREAVVVLIEIQMPAHGELSEVRATNRKSPLHAQVAQTRQQDGKGDGADHANHEELSQRVGRPDARSATDTLPNHVRFA